MLEFECPSCLNINTVPRSMAGQIVTCSHCQAQLELPEELDEEEQLPNSNAPTEEIQQSFGTPVSEFAESETSAYEDHDQKIKSPATQPQTFPCERCGNFMAERPEAIEPRICEVCEERNYEFHIPFDRETWTFSAVFAQAKEVYFRDSNWLKLSMIFFALYFFFSVCTVPLNILVSSTPTPGRGPSGLAVLLICLFVYVGGAVFFIMLQRWIHICVAGHDLRLGVVFDALKQAGRVVLFYFTFFILLIVIVLIITIPLTLAAMAFKNNPGPVALISTTITMLFMLLSMPFAVLVLSELAYDPDSSIFRAYKNSFLMVRGQLFSFVGMSLLALIFGLTGIFACCFGAYATIPFGLTFFAVFHRALRSGLGLERVSLE